jgi:hypothetical protein
MPLPLWGANYSFEDALVRAVKAEKAMVRAANGDSIELVKAVPNPAKNCLTLLFHRGSPSAADPSYRRSALEGGQRILTVRQANREPDEEQSYSAHLVIHGTPNADNEYRAALEEIPGLSMGAVREIIGLALNEYKIDFLKDNVKHETHFTFRPTPIKSETLTSALKRGGASFVTLTKPADAGFVDGDDTFCPETETMRIRVIGELTDRNWQQKIGDLITRASSEGWVDSSVDLALENGKRKTVKMEREIAAKEVIFVLAEEVVVANPLQPCSTQEVNELVGEMLKVIENSVKAGRK